MCALVMTCKSLTELILSSCISDSALLVIAEHSASLQTLDLRECFKVTEVGLGAVVHGCKELRRLVVRYDRVSYQVQRSWETEFPQLEYLLMDRDYVIM